MLGAVGRRAIVRQQALVARPAAASAATSSAVAVDGRRAYTGSNTSQEEDEPPQATGLWQRVREFMLFQPDYKGYETYANKSRSGQGYRYPSPGSQGKDAFVPTAESTDDLYNIQFYTKDTQNNYVDPVLVTDVEGNLRVPASEQAEATVGGSPGNKNPAVLRYDPTGTRSAMTTTWDAMNAQLEEALPDHLPTPWWARKGVDLVAEAKTKGIPVAPGKPLKWRGYDRSGEW